MSTVPFHLEGRDSKCIQNVSITARLRHRPKPDMGCPHCLSLGRPEWLARGGWPRVSFTCVSSLMHWCNDVSLSDFLADYSELFSEELCRVQTCLLSSKLVHYSNSNLKAYSLTHSMVQNIIWKA